MRFFVKIQTIAPPTTFNSHDTGFGFKRVFSSFQHLLTKRVEPPPSDNAGRKLLKVAIIGCPNVGKSTIINQLIGRPVFAMSKKVHTTNCCSKGIFTEGSTQIVFLDTPGLISLQEFNKYKLTTSYFKGGEDAIYEADLIAVVQDVSNKYTRDKLDPKIVRLLYLYKEKDSILLLNKVDTIKTKRTLLKISNDLTRGKIRTSSFEANDLMSEKLSELDIQDIVKKEHQWSDFRQIFMISALLGSGIDDVRQYLLNSARAGEWLFEPETYTDKKPARIIEDTVRSKLLEHLPQEVPYNLEVELEYLDMENEELISAVVLVWYPSERLERLIKGIKGGRIKMISAEAEQEIADAFLTDAHLKIVLKRKEGNKKLSNEV